MTEVDESVGKWSVGRWVSGKWSVGRWKVVCGSVVGGFNETQKKLRVMTRLFAHARILKTCLGKLHGIFCLMIAQT